MAEEAPVPSVEESKPMLEAAAEPARRGLTIRAVALGSTLLLAGAVALAAIRPAAGPARIDAEPALIEDASFNKNDILERHNIYRCMHGVGPLTWDAGLAASAQGAVNRLGFKHSGTNNGENLAWKSNGYNIDMVDMWYNEIEYTSGHKGLVSRFSGSTGHYTQLVWKGSSKLGCGYAKNTLNCQYSKAGNYRGQFGSNVLNVKKSYSQCRSSGRSSSSNACAFPTKYKGVSYPGCTTEGHTEAWCNKKGGGWRGCTAGDRACELPFKYHGKSYSKCTSAGHDRPWCYLVGGGYKNC